MSGMGLGTILPSSLMAGILLISVFVPVNIAFAEDIPALEPGMEVTPWKSEIDEASQRLEKAHLLIKDCDVEGAETHAKRVFELGTYIKVELGQFSQGTIIEGAAQEILNAVNAIRGGTHYIGKSVKTPDFEWNTFKDVQFGPCPAYGVGGPSASEGKSELGKSSAEKEFEEKKAKSGGGFGPADIQVVSALGIAGGISLGTGMGARQIVKKKGPKARKLAFAIGAAIPLMIILGAVLVGA